MPLIYAGIILMGLYYTIIENNMILKGECH